MGGSDLRSMNAVATHELTHHYPPQGKSPARQALRGVSFEVPQGEIFGVLGPNGGGKSTLFKILSTGLRADSGKAEILGLDCFSKARRIRPKIGVVFQNPSLDKKLTVRENMLCMAALYGLSGKTREKRVDELLDRYRVRDRAEDFAETLSGGLRRRVELAKALIHKPEVLLMDEPSTGLDPGGRKDFWDHLRELKNGLHTTILVTTHLMEEAERCDRLAILDQGQIKVRGTPEELKAAIGGDIIAIASPDPAALRDGIRKKFGAEVRQVDATLLLERPAGHAFLPELFEAFPSMIRSVSVGKPTLEDVFIRATGHRFWTENPS